MFAASLAIDPNFSHSGQRYGHIEGELVGSVWRAQADISRHDAEAGHFFDVDDEKLERLRELTRELRYGKDTLDSSSGFETESEGSDVDNDDDDGVHEAWEDEPRTGSSGGRGDDEMTDVDLSSTLSKQKRSVPWFEQ